MVSNIRNRGDFAEHRAELEELGFDFGSQENSPGWEVIKATLLVYHDIHGDLLVKQSFKVPDEEPWPEDMRGKGLGAVVDSIRNKGCYAEHRAELGAMGFDYSSQEKSPGWEVIMATLLVYRDIHKDLLVPYRFKVPDEEPWPEDMWGKSLG